jgi:hypothetical protein
MTNAGSRRVFGGVATSESMQSSGKDISSGAGTKGKLALRDSNVTTSIASRTGKTINGKPVTAAAALIRTNKHTTTAPVVDDVDRPVRVSKRATTASGIPSRTKSIPTTSTNSRANSVQSTGLQKSTTAKTAKPVVKDERGIKRIKTDRGEKRVVMGNVNSKLDNEVNSLLHKKPAAVKEEVLPAKDEGWEDLDSEDADDPLMVAEYVNEIFDYMKEIEVCVCRCSDCHVVKLHAYLSTFADGLHPQR